MEHQPFQTWITTELPLQPEQKEELNAHLTICEDCRRLQQNWNALATQLSTPVFAEPAPGFTTRWRSNLAERRERQRQIQVHRTLTILIVGAAVSLTALLAYVFSIYSPSDILIGLLKSGTEALIGASDIRQTATFILNSVNPVLPLTIWIIFSSILSLLSIAWVTTLWRISTQGVKSK
jgi:predicted anti-sigma-YlaC factor YlaD